MKFSVRAATSVVVLLVLGVTLFGAIEPHAARADVPPDLSVEKGVLEAGPYVPGQTLHYFLVVTNEGGDMPAGSSIEVRDLLPSRVEFQNAAEGARAMMPFFLGVSCTSAGREVTCAGPALVQGDHFVVIIEVELHGPGTYVNQAWVEVIDGGVERKKNNNHAHLNIRVE